MKSCTLNGEFKFLIIDEFKRPRLSSDFFSNFITSNGLSFPYYTGFAGLLTYLSLGSGTGYNYIGVNESPTSGLYSPILEKGFVNSTGFLTKSVGSTLNNSGITFYKTWAIPDEDSTSTKDYDIKEFSISTFSPDIFISNSKIVEGNIYTGQERSINPKYLNLTGIFSRATGDFQLKSGEQLFVTYRLNLGFETGVKTFINVVGTNGANKTKESYKSFDYFSGIYSLISPAVHVLLPLENSDLQGDPGTIKEVDHIGVGMEPSTLRDNLFCYFSEDESQFLLKTSGQGGVFENETQYTNNGGWNNSQGICAYSYDSPLVKNSIAKNIRLKEISAPDQSNIFVEKINDAYVFKNTTCSILTQPQYFQINGTGRQRSIVRSFGFLADETNELHQFKSLVLGYQKSEENNPPDEKKIIPFVDCLFGTSSGELKPSTGIYQKLIDQNLVDFTGWLPNSGDYIKLDGNNNLTLSFKLIWSSPCSDAIDCS